MDPAVLYDLYSAITSQAHYLEAMPNNCSTSPLPWMRSSRSGEGNTDPPTPYLGTHVSNVATYTNQKITQYHIALALPEKYDGLPGKYKSFLMQCAVMFASTPSHFSKDVDQI